MGDIKLSEVLSDFSCLRSGGQAARQRGDHAEALEHFRAAAAMRPDETWPRFDVAWSLDALGRFEEAEAIFRDVVAKDPQLAHGWRGLGAAARRRGDRDTALEHFRKASSLDPEQVWTLLDVATELQELGRLEEAAAGFRAIVEKDSRVMQGWRGLGLLARRRGDHSSALEHFRKAAALLPEQAWPQLEIAWTLGALSRFEEAEAIFRDVVAKDPKSAHGWRGLGTAARRRGDREQALQHFSTAARLDPEQVWTLLDVATELQELGRLDEAATAFRAVVEKNPGVMQAWRCLGQYAKRRGDHAEALEHFRKAAALLPDQVWPQFEIAWSLDALGRFDEAEAICRDVVAKDPQSAHGWRGLGAAARRRGERAQALEHFRAAARLDPEQVWTQQDVALELRELGRFDEAEELLKSFVAAHPDSAPALIVYANGLRHRAAASELIALFEKAVALEPGNIQARLTLADEYLRNWRLDEAERHYDAALADHDRNIAALLGKGQLARRRGQRDVALKFFELAATTPAAPEWAIIEHSRELLDAGRFDEARDTLLAAIASDPRKPSFHMNLGYNARAMGDRPAAREAFMKAAELETGREQARMELAIEDFHQGRSDQAVALLDAILSENPRKTQALTALANMAQQLDDMQGAISLRQAAVAIDASHLWNHLSLAQTFARVGQFPEAEEALEKCALKFGLVPEIEVAKARLRSDRGEYAAALALLDKAAARFPDHFEIWFARVTALVACGAFDEARRAANTPPAHGAPERTQLYALRGQLAAAEWDLDAAYANFQAGLQIKPNDQGLHDGAARIALLRADVDAVQFHLEMSVRNNPVHRLQHNGALKPSQTHIGQLLDEFRIDAVALKRLRAGLSAEDRVASLAALVVDMPDYTPAAMCLLIALRQTGSFSRTTPAPSERPTIPPRITQFWDENIPADIEALCEGWRQAHPTFQYTRYSKGDARRFLAENGPPGALAAFDRAAEPAMKADIFRLACLFHQGGYYIDADDRCLAPLETLDPGGRSLILYQEDFGTTANNFIGVVPRHPVIGLALTSAIEAINRGDSDLVWLATGPGLLTRSVARFLAEGQPERLNEILILERHELFEAVAIHCAASYKQTNKHWSRTAFHKGSCHAQLGDRLPRNRGRCDPQNTASTSS